MTLRVNITADIRRAKRFYSELGDNAIRSATANALNIIGRRVRTESINEIAKLRKLKKTRIGKAVRITARASKFDLRVVVEAHGTSIPLKDFGAKQNGTGVTVNVTGKRKHLSHAFGPGYAGTRIIRVRRDGKTTKAKRRAPPVLGGHVFLRTGPRRKPIKKLYGPSVPSAFIRAQVRQRQKKLLVHEWPAVHKLKLDDQLRRLRARYGG